MLWGTWRQTERIKNSPVRAVGITADCRHVLAVCGAGFIWRYEFISASLAAKEEEQGAAGVTPAADA